MPAVISPISHKTQLPCVLSEKAFHRISSLEKKPLNGKKPAIANVPMVITQNVHGIGLRKPPI